MVVVLKTEQKLLGFFVFCGSKQKRYKIVYRGCLKNIPGTQFSTRTAVLRSNRSSTV
eukprot:SAG11_NODE_1531_length_4736_cov_2.690317_7_plen_57_part_00